MCERFRCLNFRRTLPSSLTPSSLTPSIHLLLGLPVNRLPSGTPLQIFSWVSCAFHSLDMPKPLQSCLFSTSERILSTFKLFRIFSFLTLSHLVTSLIVCIPAYEYYLNIVSPPFSFLFNWAVCGLSFFFTSVDVTKSFSDFLHSSFILCGYSVLFFSDIFCHSLEFLRIFS